MVGIDGALEIRMLDEPNVSRKEHGAVDFSTLLAEQEHFGGVTLMPTAHESDALACVSEHAMVMEEGRHVRSNVSVEIGENINEWVPNGTQVANELEVSEDDYVLGIDAGAVVPLSFIRPVVEAKSIKNKKKKKWMIFIAKLHTPS
ncbi:hypothetical protein DITRI_Ditri13aG0104000 [Diplodiscus trichospermus]